MEDSLKESLQRLTPAELVQRFLAEKERADENEKKAASETARADENEKKAASETARAASETARADKNQALKEGSYYSRINHVITYGPEAIPTGSLENVRRDHRCDSFYKTAIDAAEAASEELLRPAMNASRTSGYDEATKKEARKRKRSVEAIGIDSTTQMAAEIAHLVPHSPKCSSVYGQLLEALVGVEFPEPKMQRLQVLIHGQMGENCKEKKTGIKHCVMNLIRVMHKKKFMDGHPSKVLLLPILELAQVLNFDNRNLQDQEYSIAVLCSEESVYKEMLLTGDYEICDETELLKAVTTLRDFTFAVAEHARDNVTDADVASITSEKTTLKVARPFLKDSQVVAPSLATTQPVRVLKLKLANDGKCATTCDPWLLCLKSAIMFSSFVGQKLLPGCMPSPELASVFDSSEDVSWGSCSSPWPSSGVPNGRVPDDILEIGSQSVSSDISN